VSEQTFGSDRTLELPVMRGQVLGVTVLRGYAKICDLASISKADVFDQAGNPTGTQRDLSPKHARRAYEYVRNRDLAFWPEVFLCARIGEAFRYVPSQQNDDIGTLRVYLDIATDPDRIAISRVDGNHRLHYADGSQKGFPRIERTVSFCLAYDLTLEQEITLFRDINDNQRRMNTSHLDNIEARLTGDERLKREEPDLYIARQLGRDEDSALHGRVYEGGKRTSGQHIPLRTLKSGVRYMLSRPTKLTAINDADAQYRLISNYFHALKRWHPRAWEHPGQYLILRGAGLWGGLLHRG
jgi:DGQHR domain-containing protein